MTSRLLRYAKIFGYFDGYKLYKHTKSKSTGPLTLNGFAHPLFFRGIDNDKFMFEQIFLDKQYNIEINFDPKIIIDLGANVGFASVYFANRFPNAKILAVEPDDSNYQTAIKNLEPYKNVTVIKGAVWDKSENINLVDLGFGEAAYMVQPGAGENMIKAYTIPELLSMLNVNEVDILKIDIEGSEKELFEDGDSWINKSKIIIVETHDRYKKGTSKAVFNAIGKYDFSLELSGENMVLYNNLLTKERV